MPNEPPSVSPTPKQTLSVQEVSELLGISRNSAFKAVKAGHIPALRIGRRILIPKQALKKLLDVYSIAEPEEELYV